MRHGGGSSRRRSRHGPWRVGGLLPGPLLPFRLVQRKHVHRASVTGRCQVLVAGGEGQAVHIRLIQPAAKLQAGEQTREEGIVML